MELRRGILFLSLLVTVFGCSGDDGDPQYHGDLRKMIETGNSWARISLSEMEIDQTTFAVGILEGLLGQVTIFEGKIWITGIEYPNQVETVVLGESDAELTFMISTKVRYWEEFLVSKWIPQGRLPRALEILAEEAEIPEGRAFPFVIHGDLYDLEYHIVRGGNPFRKGASGGSIPYRLEASKVEDGTIFGFYDARDDSGSHTPPGKSIYMHVLLEEPDPVTGFVDRVSLGDTVRIWLPVERPMK